MANKVNNEKEFLVLEVSKAEIINCGGFGICDSCNSQSDKGYYIAVLNSWLCPDCYNKWMLKAKRYEEDSEHEARNYKFYSTQLGL